MRYREAVLMPDNLPIIHTSELSQATDAAREFLQSSRADNTLRAYRAAWADFESFCRRSGLQSLPAEPQTVAFYLASLPGRGLKASTIKLRRSAIMYAHRPTGQNPVDHPGVAQVLDGIRRTLATAPTKKTALTVQVLERVLRKIPDDLAGVRDRALLLVGFAAALRRSELAALDVTDIQRHPKGLVVKIRRSKTDQHGEGMVKVIPRGKRLHVIEALDAWIAAGKITHGPLFRLARGITVGSSRITDGQIARVIKCRLRRAGFDARTYSGHSLRSGFITSAAEAGASLQSIADVAGHEKLDTTRGYVQVADAFQDHAGRKFL
jgi:site-specific recombinase XerD